MKQKIAIVGFGWLGLPLGKKLRLEGFEVIGTCTSKSKLQILESLEFTAEILNLNEHFEEFHFKEFFADSSICVLTIPPSKCIFHAYQNQCLKLISLFPESTKFIFTSSTSVYNDEKNEVFEDSNVLSDFNFTSQLFQTEMALKKVLGARLTILRLGGLFGPDRNPAKFLAGKKQVQNSNSPVNLVHIEDVMSFILKVILNQSWNEIYNVCCSEHPIRKDFYTWKCQKDGLEIPEFDENSMSKIKKVVSNQKGKASLNFNYLFDSPFDF